MLIRYAVYTVREDAFTQVARLTTKNSAETMAALLRRQGKKAVVIGTYERGNTIDRR